MIKIKIPNNNIKERSYMLDIIFDEFLGLKFEVIENNDCQDWIIELENKKVLTIKDTFFNKYPKDLEYLKLENIPSEIEELDIFAASFFMLTRWEEYVNKNRDIHDRFPAYESLAYKQGFLDRPIVNEYVEELKTMLLELDSSLIFKTREFQLVLTHDVEKLSTHGGSLRIYASHIENNKLEVNKSVNNILNEEKEFGLLEMDIYENFQVKADKVKYNLIDFLIKAKKENKKVIAYGAAAKGNTLLNYAGVKNDMIEFVVDKSPHKQGKYLPASHIAIVDEEKIKEVKPDYILILPWNIKDEVIAQLEYVEEWDCKFVVAVPTLEVI
ncbi:MAG: methyltransferase C-terminal domain-containing protein [Patescibacteria group bacterium]|nr:methyltransferase C-terminal domain-containing protein [Patescibacteria group bacterium]